MKAMRTCQVDESVHAYIDDLSQGRSRAQVRAYTLRSVHWIFQSINLELAEIPGRSVSLLVD